jgi:cobalamin biosynthesis protein CobC
MLEHGGRLRLAAIKYGKALEQWLDLSTGISPNSYPIPEIPPEVWRRLPEEADDLENVARNYYGAQDLLAVAGSQAAIQCLPKLRPHSRVALLSLAYNEHAYAWKREGHEVLVLSEKSLIEQRPDVDVLVVCNPNNPTGFVARPEVLLAWLKELVEKGGWLVVDEAFMDSTPELSMSGLTGINGLVVLRSIGKFFGLAGVRAGFVLGWRELIDQFRDKLGPWAVNGPARYVVSEALIDFAWQNEQSARLRAKAQRLEILLKSYGLEPGGSTHYFVWVPHPRAREIFEALCEGAVLTRLFDHVPSLRFGLPATEDDWQQLESALAIVNQTVLSSAVRPNLVTEIVY